MGLVGKGGAGTDICSGLQRQKRLILQLPCVFMKKQGNVSLHTLAPISTKQLKFIFNCTHSLLIKPLLLLFENDLVRL